MRGCCGSEGAALKQKLTAVNFLPTQFPQSTRARTLSPPHSDQNSALSPGALRSAATATATSAARRPRRDRADAKDGSGWQVESPATRHEQVVQRITRCGRLRLHRFVVCWLGMASRLGERWSEGKCPLSPLKPERSQPPFHPRSRMIVGCEHVALAQHDRDVSPHSVTIKIFAERATMRINGGAAHFPLAAEGECRCSRRRLPQLRLLGAFQHPGRTAPRVCPSGSRIGCLETTQARARASTRLWSSGTDRGQLGRQQWKQSAPRVRRRKGQGRGAERTEE